MRESITVVKSYWRDSYNWIAPVKCAYCEEASATARYLPDFPRRIGKIVDVLVEMRLGEVW